MTRPTGQISFHKIQRKLLIVVWVVIGLLSAFSLQAQTREELERNKRRIEQEIVLINQLLQETQSTAELNISQLVILNNRIQSRQNLITSINNEIGHINRNISANQQEVAQIKQELEELRESYARMIYYAYKNRSSYQRMMFLFSSRDFNQAYLRLRYLQQLTRHRQVQAEKITETAVKLEESILALQEQKNAQQLLLEEQRAEMEQLSREQQAQTRNVDQLKKRESELLQQLREQEKAAQDLQKAIETIIEEERRKAEQAAREAGRPASEGFTLTPAEQLISQNFAENKGKLPWPLERGIITGHFGEQPHPILPGITIANNGIDISTTQGSRARAIFEGTVARVFTIPGGYAVIIRHGDYLTVYAHLSEVFVRNGEKIQTGQELGIVATEPRESKTYVHLEVWHGNNKLNPADWIARHR